MDELSLSDPNNPIWSKLDQILAMDNSTTSFTVDEQDDGDSRAPDPSLEMGKNPSASLDMTCLGGVPTSSAVAQEQQQPPVTSEDSAYNDSTAPGPSEVQLRNDQANTGSYNPPLIWVTSGTFRMTLSFSAETQPEQRGSPLSMNPSSSVPPLVGSASFKDKKVFGTDLLHWIENTNKDEAGRLEKLFNRMDISGKHLLSTHVDAGGSRLEFLQFIEKTLEGQDVTPLLWGGFRTPISCVLCIGHPKFIIDRPCPKAAIVVRTKGLLTERCFTCTERNRNAENHLKRKARKAEKKNSSESTACQEELCISYASHNVDNIKQGKRVTMRSSLYIRHWIATSRLGALLTVLSSKCNIHSIGTCWSHWSRHVPRVQWGLLRDNIGWAIGHMHDMASPNGMAKKESYKIVLIFDKMDRYTHSEPSSLSYHDTVYSNGSLSRSDKSRGDIIATSPADYVYDRTVADNALEDLELDATSMQQPRQPQNPPVIESVAPAIMKGRCNFCAKKWNEYNKNQRRSKEKAKR
ncbi:hypothetical protein HD553DRAFT_325708 [Filobasidium floriforme]|uniref:uncharacterized protein n=1 Tax=Filobasidium floriforme TaxID=5210 RepID=UPI001E8E4609|nr:uncharacterized protein HD553DRAFT_325708 [Filobasidium floriforme]KAH8081278.1 hypothetical protein HD553DRAFT_325708 [Filobasidium floriforme]